MAENTSPSATTTIPPKPLAPAQAAPSAPQPAALPQQPANVGTPGAEKKA